MNITLPVLPLREYQQKIWDELFKKNTKKAFLVWHRRAGKDLFCLQYMVARAFLEKGNYWYILPQQNQVRRAIWEGITSEGFKYLDMIPKEIVYKILDNEMKIVLRDPQNPTEPGSIISFIGGDRYDNLVGAGIKGAVISEFALQKPNLFDLAIEPMLKETNGWVIFNTTPRGENHAYKMLNFIKKTPDYLASVLTIDDTKAVNPASLEEERQRGKPEELIQQEYYCSFAGAIFGAIYADMLSKAKYGDYPYDARYLVHTMWDLGVSDCTSIWFVQWIEGRPRLIDFYENNGYGYAHYASLVSGKGYNYGFHCLPHDGHNRQMTPTEMALAPETQLLNLGLNNIKIITRTSNIMNDINNTRALIPICEFDEKCNLGYQSLKQYHKERDEKRDVFKDTPDHDWASHAADAFRILPALEKLVIKPRATFTKPKVWNGKFC